MATVSPIYLDDGTGSKQRSTYGTTKSIGSIPGTTYVPSYYNQNTSNALVAPSRTTFADVLPGIQDIIGPSQQISKTTLAGVSSIPGFSQDYYDQLFEDAKSKLYNQYYGMGGLQEQSQEDLASRGMLGSTIETKAGGILGQQYGEGLRGVLGDITKLKTEQDIEEARRVRELQQERDIKQSEMDQAVNIKNAEFDNAMKELGIRSALTESGDITKYDVGMFEQQVNLEDIARQDEYNRKKLYMDLLSSPNIDLTDVQQRNILNSIFGNEY